MIFYLTVIICSLACLYGSLAIMKASWARYGWLYLFSAAVGLVICLIFVLLGFYSFPNRLLRFSPIPVIEMFFIIPFLVLAAVRHSPSHWKWKIPFYWGLVHLVVLLEYLTFHEPFKIINYQFAWDLWDSYTWWWIYFLAFEWVGGLMVPQHARKPIDAVHLQYGKLGWGILHFILIATIFLAGVYTGIAIK